MNLSMDYKGNNYIDCWMGEEGMEYTSIDFLSKIRIAPKRNLFKQLSLDTDLEELSKVMSPREAGNHKPPLDSLNKDRTRRFIVEIIAKYENQQEAHSKWEAFLASIHDEEAFDTFIHSIKTIQSEKKAEAPVNPESDLSKQLQSAKQIKPKGRSYSAQKKGVGSAQAKEQLRGQQQKRVLRQKLKKQVSGLRDLLLAGQRFIHQAKHY